jgi:DNA-nicking Smr family endonuclease
MSGLVREDGMATRRLRDGEQRLWLDTMHAVQPLKGRAPVRPPLDTPTVAAPVAAAPVAEVRPAVRAAPVRPPIEIGTRRGGLDDTSWRMLGNGKLRPQRRLDLHGQRAEQAFRLLHAFLVRAQSERLRCVEIITGAGTGPEGGILRRELPHWLSRADLRPLVLAAVHPHARNVGSVRLLLRRRS